MTQPSPNGSLPFTGIMAIQQRNLSALVAAQMELVTGMADLLARYQSETLKAMLSAAAVIPWTSPPRDTSAAIALMFDTVKNATLESMARSNALSETAELASGEVSATLNTRWLAALDEWKAALTATAGPVAAA